MGYFPTTSKWSVNYECFKYFLRKNSAMKLKKNVTINLNTRWSREKQVTVIKTPIKNLETIN